MEKKYIVLKSVVSVISGFVGGFVGAFGGKAGSIVGVLSGLIVGYFYAHYTVNIKKPSRLARIGLGIFYGTVAGLISGVSVHIPKQIMHRGGEMLFLGAIFGIIIGAVLGLVLSIIIASIPRETKSE